jgi:DNA/RNA endonuclease YhcR with UshA esterase domain
MKGWGIRLLVLAILALPATCSQATGNAPKYDKSTEVKVSGVVTDVKDYDCPISGTMGAHITIQPQQGPAIEVHVAATKYIKSYEMVFAKGDKVEVLGSKVEFNGADAIIAREILRGQDTFTFRDGNGKALW